MTTTHKFIAKPFAEKYRGTTFHIRYDCHEMLKTKNSIVQEIPDNIVEFNGYKLCKRCESVGVTPEMAITRAFQTLSLMKDPVASTRSLLAQLETDGWEVKITRKKRVVDAG